MPQTHATDPAGSRARLAGRHTARPPVSLDARLWARFRDGEPDAVRAAYSAYGPLVYGVAYAILADRGLSEQATQQTFLKAWRSAGSVDPTRELGAWLATIAGRVSIDIYRRETGRAAKPLEAVRTAEPALVSPRVRSVKSRCLGAHRRLASELGHLWQREGWG
jgi:DNA-directed RNA polymerase specialized sigma24 family protein